jgi:NAD(P)H-dependent flavin oxidoreductase YrpB (nitropropane dioxygenase family)
MPTGGMTGDVEEMALYAGQAAGLVRDVLPAAQIVRAVADEAARVLAGLTT